MSQKRGSISEDRGRAGQRAKVFVGMSGGVDSSVSAALLTERGFEVTGVFIKVWQPDFFPCTAAEDRLDAMRVCAHLDIPFRTLDLEAEYKTHVLNYMVESYGRGDTPNPDVMCNKWIKFGSFLDYALREGADAIATGHYARGVKTDSGFELHRGVDAEKDQSYFLWTLGQTELSRSMFPVGDFQKEETRALARKLALPTAAKKDSQGLCFLGKLDMGDFLKRYLDLAPGEVVDEHGAVIGTHEGALIYTIGQRHGFTIRGEGSGVSAHYVIRKDLEKNQLVVGTSPAQSGERELVLHHINWISRPPEVGARYALQTRYRQTPFLAEVRGLSSGSAILRILDGPSLFASGQSCVLYDGTRCVGGGIIGSA